jgi:hypothetical protein
VPNQQVVQVMEFETADEAMRGEMTATFTLVEADGGTELLAVHDNVPPGVAPADNELGWWAVVKQCAPAEASFYWAAAPMLRAAGVGIPELWWLGERGAADWLLLEYLPAAPLRAAWLANQGWMRTLARLHQLPLDVSGELGAPYRPSWGPNTTDGRSAG